LYQNRGASSSGLFLLVSCFTHSDRLCGSRICHIGWQ
jgi:hypothetical protein